jgi:hypothetical protein
VIWVLVILALNLPLGTIPRGDIAGIVHLSNEECQAERVRLDRYLKEQGAVLNVICIAADNTPAPAHQPTSNGSRRRS